VLFELLLLEENHEVQFTSQEGVGHSVELEVDQQRDPRNDWSSGIIGLHPAIETFISDILFLHESANISVVLQVVVVHERHPFTFFVNVVLVTQSDRISVVSIRVLWWNTYIMEINVMSMLFSTIVLEARGGLHVGLTTLILALLRY
jgi:hypothetical protein